MTRWDIYPYPFEQEEPGSIFILGLEGSPAGGCILLRCSLGQRPLRASSLAHALHLRPRHSPEFVGYPTVSSVTPRTVANTSANLHTS